VFRKLGSLSKIEVFGVKTVVRISLHHPSLLQTFKQSTFHTTLPGFYRYVIQLVRMSLHQNPASPDQLR
jgi:hypothetical protein